MDFFSLNDKYLDGKSLETVLLTNPRVCIRDSRRRM